MRCRRRRQDDRRDVGIGENFFVRVGCRNVRIALIDFGAMVRMDVADGFDQAFSALNKLW